MQIARIFLILVVDIAVAPAPHRRFPRYRSNNHLRYSPGSAATHYQHQMHQFAELPPNIHFPQEQYGHYHGPQPFPQQNLMTYQVRNGPMPNMLLSGEFFIPHQPCQIFSPTYSVVYCDNTAMPVYHTIFFDDYVVFVGYAASNGQYPILGNIPGALWHAQQIPHSQPLMPYQQTHDAPYYSPEQLETYQQQFVQSWQYQQVAEQMPNAAAVNNAQPRAYIEELEENEPPTGVIAPIALSRNGDSWDEVDHAEQNAAGGGASKGSNADDQFGVSATDPNDEGVKDNEINTISGESTEESNAVSATEVDGELLVDLKKSAHEPLKIEHLDQDDDAQIKIADDNYRPDAKSAKASSGGKGMDVEAAAPLIIDTNHANMQEHVVGTAKDRKLPVQEKPTRKNGKGPRRRETDKGDDALIAAGIALAEEERLKLAKQKSELKIQTAEDLIQSFSRTMNERGVKVPLTVWSPQFMANLQESLLPADSDLGFDDLQSVNRVIVQIVAMNELQGTFDGDLEKSKSLLTRLNLEVLVDNTENVEGVAIYFSRTMGTILKFFETAEEILGKLRSFTGSKFGSLISGSVTTAARNVGNLYYLVHSLAAEFNELLLQSGAKAATYDKRNIKPLAAMEMLSCRQFIEAYSKRWKSKGMSIPKSWMTEVFIQAMAASMAQLSTSAGVEITNALNNVIILQLLVIDLASKSVKTIRNLAESRRKLMGMESKESALKAKITQSALKNAIQLYNRELALAVSEHYAQRTVLAFADFDCPELDAVNAKMKSLEMEYLELVSQ